MATRYVDLPLFSDPFYQYSISLEDNSYLLEFLYNSRMQLYTLTLKTADNVVLFTGVALVPLYPIAQEYAIDDLSGAFLLLPKSADVTTESYKKYPRELNQYYDFSYVYEV